jgi:hypothetical protein
VKPTEESTELSLVAPRGFRVEELSEERLLRLVERLHAKKTVSDGLTSTREEPRSLVIGEKCGRDRFVLRRTDVVVPVALAHGPRVIWRASTTATSR